MQFLLPRLMPILSIERVKKWILFLFFSSLCRLVRPYNTKKIRSTKFCHHRILIELCCVPMDKPFLLNYLIHKLPLCVHWYISRFIYGDISSWILLDFCLLIFGEKERKMDSSLFYKLFVVIFMIRGKS